MELTREQLDRNDEIDQAVYACICTLAEKELPWNMEVIGLATEHIQALLERHGIKMRWPGIVTHEDGTETYEDGT